MVSTGKVETTNFVHYACIQRLRRLRLSRRGASRLDALVAFRTTVSQAVFAATRRAASSQTYAASHGKASAASPYKNAARITQTTRHAALLLDIRCAIRTPPAVSLPSAPSG